MQYLKLITESQEFGDDVCYQTDIPKDADDADEAVFNPLSCAIGFAPVTYVTLSR